MEKDTKTQAYEALQSAVKRITEAAYSDALSKQKKTKKQSAVRYDLPPQVRTLVDASSDVLKGTITPEQAMNLLHDPTILYLRTRSPNGTKTKKP